MIPLNQLNSWPVLWHLAQEFNATLSNVRFQRAFTFQKRRLDLLFEKDGHLHQVTWLIQHNTPLIFQPNTASVAKRHVHLFQELPENTLLINITLSQSDRLLRFEFENGFEMEFGFFPKARNVVLKKDSLLIQSFLKNETFPESQNDYSSTDAIQLHLLENNIVFPGTTQHLNLFNEMGKQYFDTTHFIQHTFETEENEFNSISHAIQIHRRPQGSKAPKIESIGIDKAAKSIEQRWLKKIDKLEQDLKISRNWESIEHEAQLLQLAIAYKLKPENGVIKISTEISNDEGAELKVDTSISLSDNVALLYKKAKKQRLKLQEISPIIDQTKNDILKLKTLIDSNDDKELQSFLESHGIRLAINKNETVEHKPYKLAQSPSGLDVLIGKSATDNDHLTFKIAHKYDWWFHARGVHGSHIILRTGKSELRQDDKLFVAKLAAQNSDDRHSGVVAVQFTQKRHLTKPKGSPPGLVLVHQEQVIFVEP